MLLDIRTPCSMFPFCLSISKIEKMYGNFQMTENQVIGLKHYFVISS